MANTEISYDEIRLDVRDPELTHCYVFIRNVSRDGMLGVEGWHHKAFPASLTVQDVLQAWADGDNPLLWPLEAPPEPHAEVKYLREQVASLNTLLDFWMRPGAGG